MDIHYSHPGSNCEDLHRYFDELHNSYTIYIEEPPILISKYSLNELTNVEVNNFSGEIYVEFIINEMGDPVCLRIKKSSNCIFNSYAEEIISSLKFKPAKQKGREISTRMVLPVRFNELKD